MPVGFLSVADAAERLGVSKDHVRRHAPIIHLGRRTLVPESWLEGLATLPTLEPEPVPSPRRERRPTGRTFDFDRT